VRRGIVYATLAYIFWGVFPIYIKALKSVPALEFLAHRMVWSLGVVLILLLAARRWSWLRDARREPRILIWFVGSALAVTLNWGLYIWAVNAGHIIDTSLGYYINPLVNVLIGAIFLHERLRPGQWFAVGLAALGVSWLTWQAGQLPWISLTLALTFATYGLLRKMASLGSLEGLAVETALLFPFALSYLLWLIAHDESAFVAGPASTQWLLVAAGPVTAIPLLLFAGGARRIPFATLGVLQYVAPTLQLLLGIGVYHEPFAAAKLVGYVAIWIALIIFTGEGLWSALRAHQ